MPKAPETPTSTKPRCASASRRRIRWTLIATALAAGFAVPLFTGIVDAINAPPRLLAPYVAKRAQGHRPALVAFGDSLARWLLALDRGEVRTEPPNAATSAGFVPRRAMATASRTTRAPLVVATREAVLGAIAHARPGDVITLRPGRYRFDGTSIEVARAGSAEAPIVLQAERPGTVVLELHTLEGFRVTAPHWIFENLTIEGACTQHADCEHAFHVVGGATHFAARGNTIADFNAPFKINGEGGHFPDHGLIEHNTIGNNTARQTDQPVTLIDLVGASFWTIRGNLIRDFVKAGGDGISYGAFAKGGGRENRFEANVVLCEARLRGAPGARVGLSLGGGGTGEAYCRGGRCITEQDGSAIASNLIASCSDDGIYLNRASDSRIVHNTLVDTGGISVRFGESGAELVGNLVDGAIRSRDGGLIHDDDNRQTGLPQLYLGQHPLRALFRDAGQFDFAWRRDVPRRAGATPRTAGSVDLCGVSRADPPAYGAFEDFARCRATPGAATDRE